MRQSRTGLTLCAAVASALIAVPAAIATSASGRTSSGPTAAYGRPSITSAPAGTLTVDAGCYVNTASAAAKVTVNGSGWSPGDTVQLTDTRGVVTTTLTVSSMGTFVAIVPAPVVPTRDIDITDRIQAVDEGSQGSTTQGGGATGATAYSSTFLTTDYAVKVSGTINPLRKLAFNLSGFPASRTVYGHYLTASGRLLETASFGKPGGVCGLRKVDAYEYPGGRAKKGQYTIQFDDDLHYSARTTPAFRYFFVISRL
jgi:hypothetical protein